MVHIIGLSGLNAYDFIAIFEKENLTLMVVYHAFPLIFTPLHSGLLWLGLLLCPQLSKAVKVRFSNSSKQDNYVGRVYFCVIGKEFWSINSPTLSCRVWTTSANINRCVSSRSLRMNFFPRAMVSSRWSRNSFIAGSLVPGEKRKACFHKLKIICLL